MPSRALTLWTGDRTPRLDQVDGQCAAAIALIPPNAMLAEELLRGYVTLLSAHFQGYCRDLYSECAQFVSSKVRPSLRDLVRSQFMEKLQLDHGNPNMSNIAADVARFKIDFRIEARKDPSFAAWEGHLAVLNKWRNAVAHHGPAPSGVPPLALPLVRAWRPACHGLAQLFDGIMYNQVRRLTRRTPW